MNHQVQERSLYDRIGGAEAVKATVVKLYGRIMLDPLLAPFFPPDKLETLKRSQAAFVTTAFGGPHAYTGKGMREAHAALVEKGLSDEHFNAVAEHLAESMRELGVDEALITEALGIVETTRNDVLGR